MNKLFLLFSFVSFHLYPALTQFDLIYSSNQNVSEVFHHVAEDPNGNVFVAGSGANTLVLGNLTLGNSLSFVAKLNPANNWLWIAKMTSSPTQSSGSNGFILDMVVDQQGNSYITGWYLGIVNFGNISLTSTKSGYDYTSDIFVAKISPGGTFLWAKSIGSKAGKDYGSAIAIDGNGNVYVGGQYCNKKLNCQNYYGGYEVTDVFTAKLNAAGTVQWQKRFPPSVVACLAGGQAQGIALDATGNIYITGGFNASIVFGPGALTLTALGASDVFTTKLSNNGNVQWAKAGASSGSSTGREILSSGDKIFVTGSFNQDISFGEITLNPPTTFNKTFITAYSSTGIPQWATSVYYVDYDSNINCLLPEGGTAIIASEFTHGTLSFSAANGALLSTTPIENNFFPYYDSFGEKSNMMDMATSANGYVFSLLGYCGTIGFSNLSLTASCADCANWDSCWEFVEEDMFLFRSSANPAPHPNDIILIPVESDNSYKSEMHIFPNPAKDEVHVSIDELKHDANITIHDHLGRLVHTDRVNSGKTQFSVPLDNKFSEGIYIIRLQNEEISISKRFLISR